MPRVTDEHRAGRRAEILAAAARVFAVKGFHGASMADLITESGLSAGAVYSYFRSKEELIAAVADLAHATADDVFGALLADGAVPSPADAVATMITAIHERLVDGPLPSVDITRLGVQVWAEALRNPEVYDRAQWVVLRLRGHCAEVARRWQAAGNLPAGTDPDQIGAAMLSLLQGYVLQRLLVPLTDPSGYVSGVRALLA
ncbi:TetR/AcrR family transcriptional regulator [Actinoplanes hulinensis]|uniref:TetR/AcrR family transcriptional regulator n=1 Tax=Actinoplanes hulinensis TaxID=1144547 RepID=A0ABS7B8X3_9ACTN|nr:TetR/AcrR family transcriptional regulator [Actinoplanes hulinensis]MBW6437506.1 TetR/AcrR family transcriptional regulator [Actinoplanes hulinensis]